MEDPANCGNMESCLVAVGMPVTRHPPHRSVREELPHTAPTSGTNAEISGSDRCIVIDY